MALFLKKIIFVLFFALPVISGCKKEENRKKIVDINFVDDSQVKIIAASFMTSLLTKNAYQKKNFNKSTTSALPLSKRIKSSKAINDDQGVPAFYIVNYEEGGFAIVSGDRRTQKILAFSDKNAFDTEDINLGIQEWLSTSKKQIQEIRRLNIAYKGQDKVDFFKKFTIGTGKYVKNPPIDTSCTEWSNSVSPLLQTAWSQQQGYNNLYPLASSSCTMPSGNNGRWYTGCVPTAMAQVMRYYEYPTSFNYSIMPDILNNTNFSSPGADAISGLMLAAANAVDVDYKCTVTEVATSEVPGALASLGYTGNMQYLDYEGTSNYNAVISELNANRPVIFNGGRYEFWAIPHYRDGHAWVCDGYYQYFECEFQYTYLFLHMNWGRSNSSDGYYSFGNFNPESYTYNYQSSIIIGIQP